MKNEILDKLFTSRWNYAWGRVDEHLIALFYKKGGFNGLYNYVVSEKERMNKQPNSYGGFNSYYSSDLIETLEKVLLLLLSVIIGIDNFPLFRCFFTHLSSHE